MNDNNESSDAAAIYYLENFEDVWVSFVSQDVAARVKEALAGEG